MAAAFDAVDEERLRLEGVSREHDQAVLEVVLRDGALSIQSLRKAQSVFSIERDEDFPEPGKEHAWNAGRYMRGFA